MAGNSTKKSVVVSNKKIIVTQNMDYNIREMTIGDYEEALSLIIFY